MENGYKIIIQGVRSGYTAEAVALALAPVLRRPAELLLPPLQKGQAITLSLKGLPLKGARGFKEHVDKSGCASILDSLAPLPPLAASLPGDFTVMRLRTFAHTEIGLALKAPTQWQEGSESGLFRVRDTTTGTWFTASLNRAPGVTLPVWAEIRFGAVHDKMPYLQPYRAPYRLETAAGTALVAEFRGLVPGDAHPTHQLVLCLCPEAGAVSLNITAFVADFETHEAFYQWLLRTQLSLYEVAKLPLPAVAAEPPAEFWRDTALQAAGANAVSVRYGEYTFMGQRAYYATSLSNLSDRPVRVIKFGGFGAEGDDYRLGNYTGAWFSAEEFIAWYGLGPHGWIAPGQTVTDPSNWSGSNPGFWAYWCCNDLGECFIAMAHRPPSRTGGGAYGLHERPAGLPAEPWQACLETMRHTLAGNVARCQALFTDNNEAALSFDAEGLRRVEAVIERARRVSQPSQWQELIQIFGAFLGECLIRKTGGDWWRYDEVLCVRGEEETAFPFNKVMKQFHNGLEGGDSILGLYNTTGLLAPKPLSERQKKFAALIASRPDYRYYIASGTPEEDRWSPVATVDGGWVVIAQPEGQGYRESRLLHQVERLRVTDQTGRELDLDLLPMPAVPSTPPVRVAQAAAAAAEPPADAVMGQAMARLREAFEGSRKLLNRYSFESVKARAPSWLKPSDALYKIVEQQLLLCQEGQIVWAGLIQANSLLFKPGDADCPANLVYSPDPYFDARPQALRALGRRIFQLKNTVPTDAEERRIAQVITDEVDRSMMAWRVPATLTEREVLAGTFMVFRKHIPNGVLSAGCFPVLMHPQTDAVMIVPFEFWPIELIKLWKNDQL